MPTLVLLLRLFLGAVFLLSAVVKVLAPRQFVQDIRGYHILHGGVATVFGWILPYFEFAISVSLLTGFGLRWAALAAVFLLIVFMIAVSTAMIRRLNLNCSCFGLLYRERVGWRTLLRDAVLIGVASVIVIGSSKALTVADLLSNPEELSHSIGLMATVVAIGIGVLGLVLTVRQMRHIHDDASTQQGDEIVL